MSVTCASRTFHNDSQLYLPGVPIAADVDAYQNLPRSAYRTLGKIRSLAKQRGYCFATQARLAQMLCCETRTIRRHMRGLEEAGLISAARRHRNAAYEIRTLTAPVPQELGFFSSIPDEQTEAAHPMVSSGDRATNETSRAAAASMARPHSDTSDVVPATGHFDRSRPDILTARSDTMSARYNVWDTEITKKETTSARDASNVVFLKKRSDIGSTLSGDPVDAMPRIARDLEHDTELLVTELIALGVSAHGSKSASALVRAHAPDVVHRQIRNYRANTRAQTPGLLVAAIEADWPAPPAVRRRQEAAARAQAERDREARIAAQKQLAEDREREREDAYRALPAELQAEYIARARAQIEARYDERNAGKFRPPATVLESIVQRTARDYATSPTPATEADATAAG